MEQVAEQRVVFVNLVQCWRCKQYIPPGQEIRARVMVTAVQEGTRLRDGNSTTKEPVSLCSQCDTEVAQEEKLAADRSWRHQCWFWRVVGGAIIAGFAHESGLPWTLAIFGVLVLIWLKVLGRSFVAIWIATVVLAVTVGDHAAQATMPRIFPFIIGGVVLLTYGIKPVLGAMMRLRQPRKRLIEVELR